LSNAVPAAWLFDVLEHIANDVVTLSYINALLRFAGHIYFTMPGLNLLFSGEGSNARSFSPPRR
jgi:hypothetical protein